MPTTCANLVHLKEVARAVSYCVWLEVIVKLTTQEIKVDSLKIIGIKTGYGFYM